MYVKNDGCLLGSLQHIVFVCSGIFRDILSSSSGQFVGFKWTQKLCVEENVCLA